MFDRYRHACRRKYRHRYRSIGKNISIYTGAGTGYRSIGKNVSIYTGTGTGAVAGTGAGAGTDTGTGTSTDIRVGAGIPEGS